MIIEKANIGDYSMYCIPGMVITKKKTLLAYYECRKSNSDWAEIDIKIIRSVDEGENWQTVAVINGEGNTLNNPVMFVKENVLHFLFLKNYKELFHCISTDDGRNFSKPKAITIDCDFFYNCIAVGPGHGIVHDDKMIVPVWFAQNKEDPKEHRPSIIATLYSTNGEEWKLGEIIGKDILQNPSECALAVTADNKVLISIRNENNCHQRAFARSDDGISNWEELRFNSQMPDPICMGSMCYEGGMIYHINCASDTARENLTIKRSDNCFKTYESLFVDTPAGYSDIAISNGILYVVYERDCFSGLHFKKYYHK